jgi:hypothetical protein
MRISKDTKIEDIVQGGHVPSTFLLAIPTFGTVPIEFVMAFGRMQMPMSSYCESLIAKGMEVGVARDYIAEKYQKMNPRPLYLLFVGDDMLPPWNALLILYEEMKTDRWDVLSGLYFKKSMPPEPLIYRNDIAGPLEEGVHYRDGEVIHVDRTGLDFTLIRHNVFDVLGEDSRPWFKTGPTQDGENLCPHTEDTWFYDKCRAAGLKVGVHTGCKVGHFLKATQEVF